jgi:ribosome-associated toxin RatA of RatAB toxin-antitoxin module
VQIVERSALVRYTPAQMFALVNDVPSYPAFLPWCVGSQVEHISATEVIATVEVARSVLRTSFTTRNTAVIDRSISMRLERGPFKALSGEWRFDPIGAEGSRVSFRVEFEFNNKLMAKALSSVFESVCATMVGAFCDRAKAVYG